MLNKVYAGLCAAMIAIYVTASWQGWELNWYGRETPQESSARHLAGGHRSFWIAGFRGGK